MKDMSITELERELHTGEREVLDPGTLAAIRRKGGRRRTARRALTAVGTAGVVAVVGLTLAITSTGDERTNDNTSVADDPREQETPQGAQPAREAGVAGDPRRRAGLGVAGGRCPRPTPRASSGATRTAGRSWATRSR